MSPRRREAPSDITIHMKRKDGKHFTKAEARAAVWAAHKIVQRGGSVRDMREWEFEAVDWRHGKREKHYGRAAIDEVLNAIGPILEDDRTRIAVRDKGGK